MELRSHRKDKNDISIFKDNSKVIIPLLITEIIIIFLYVLSFYMIKLASANVIPEFTISLLLANLIWLIYSIQFNIYLKVIKLVKLK